MIDTTSLRVALALVIASTAGCAAPTDDAPDEHARAASEPLKACSRFNGCEPIVIDYDPQPPNGSPCTSWDNEQGTWQNGVCVVPTTHGRLLPNYYVLSVFYAPPGSQSTVDYGANSTLGTTTSTTGTFKNDASVSIATSSSLIFAKEGLTVTATNQTTSGTTASTDVKATTQSDFFIDGYQDKVTHDADIIYLWLNPQLNVDTYGSQTHWALAQRDGQDAVVLPVYVRYLRDPSTMPLEVAGALAAANITPADYAQILSVDPFATGSTYIDTARFVKVKTEAYLPPAFADQKPTVNKFGISKSTATTSSSARSTSYSVGVKLEASFGFDFFAFKNTVSLTAADTMTWTSSNSFGSSNASTLSATASITQPAYGYAGPIWCDIYVDTIYNTFFFALR